MKKIFDWVGEKINNFTGETEREDLVEELKALHSTHVQTITSSIETTNERIDQYNKVIREINQFRKFKVSATLSNLYLFLIKFGNLFQARSFAEERDRDQAILPEKKFESKSKYIEENDWEKKDYIKKILFKTVFGAKMEIRKVNLALRETIGQYKLEIRSSENQARYLQEKVNTDIQISELYNSNIRMINHVIEEKIIPEMDLIDAFMEAEAVKNAILAGRELREVTVHRKITLLRGTMYEKHYQFIKNTVYFYLICKKIYDTPVLTKLLHDETTDNDVIEIKHHTEVLQGQADLLDQVMIQEGKAHGTKRAG